MFELEFVSKHDCIPEAYIIAFSRESSKLVNIRKGVVGICWNKKIV